MKNISLKMDEAVFKDTEKILSITGKPRNRYINEAVDYYNQLQARYLLKKKLNTESNLVREGSIQVLKEFEETSNEDQAI